MSNKIKIAAIAVVTALVVVLLGAIIKHSASADYDNEEPCVPSEAWTETIEHPAVTHEETVVVQEATPDVWANFQPNDNHAPFAGPPSYPTDPRGSWNVHNQIPGGHAGPDGVYSKGNPHKGGNWFYRHNGTEEVAETITVVDEEAWTETIEHPAVECPEEPTDPTCPPEEQRPTVDPCDPPVCPTDSARPILEDNCPTDDPEEPTEPTEPPVETPEPEEPDSDIGDAISARTVCIDFDEVKTEHFINGVIDHTTFRPARPGDKCGTAPSGGRQAPASLPERYAPEEGM